jgi:hypothetical protein
MSKILLENFNGIAPLINARRLADGMAVQAQNCLFERKSLRALRAPADTGETVAADTQTIVEYQGDLLEFTDRKDVVASPIYNDAHDRLYYTDSDYPKVRSGASEYRLGIPRPSAAPVASATDVPDSDDAEDLINAETVYYRFTYVDAFGAEGPASVPSNGVERVRDTDVDLTFPSVPSGDYNFGSGALIRIYRSNTGTSDTAFQYVTELPIATASYTDDVDNAELQEVLPSAGHIGPPDDDASLWPDGPLQGLTDIGNGVVAGFTGKTLHFCEPYLPHAWPLDYRLSSKHKVVGIVKIDAGALIVTEGQPFLVVGGIPSAYSVVPIESRSQLPCASAASLVDMGSYAIYTTDRGLALVSGAEGRLVTEDQFGETDWAAYAPTTIVAGHHHGRYVGFYDDGDTPAGFIFDPQGGRDAFSTTDEYSDVLYNAAGSGALRMKQGTAVNEWDAGAALTYTWESKTFVLPYDLNFGYFELLGAPLTSIDVTLTYDGTDYTFTADSQYTVLPGNAPAKEWSITLEGTDEIHFAALHEDLAA